MSAPDVYQRVSDAMSAIRMLHRYYAGAAPSPERIEEIAKMLESGTDQEKAFLAPFAVAIRASQMTPAQVPGYYAKLGKA